MPHDPTAIRNVALVGHHGAGKTTLAEALLAATGALPAGVPWKREPRRVISSPRRSRASCPISTALAPITVNGVKVNLLDTPGYADFASEMLTALAGVDLAVVVVSATDGVQAQTEDAWRAAAKLGLPRVIVINKLDRERADFDRTLAEIRAAFGAGVAPVELPIGAEADFHGVIDLLGDTATHYDTPAPHTPSTAPSPRQAMKARSPTNWSTRSTRCTNNSSRALSSATTASWSATSAASHRLRRAGEEPGRRCRLGHCVPGLVLFGPDGSRGGPAGPADRGALPGTGRGRARDRAGRVHHDGDPLRPPGRRAAHGDQDVHRQPHGEDVAVQGDLGHADPRHRPRSTPAPAARSASTPCRHSPGMPPRPPPRSWRAISSPSPA